METEIPGLGPITADGDWYVTRPRDVPVLGRRCSFTIDGYEPADAEAVTECVEAFCSLASDALRVASEHVFAYYRSVAEEVGAEEGFPEIRSPAQVWDFVQLTEEPLVAREEPGGPWFVALENECSWEPEHGLMIVLKEGCQVTKVSQYDGHLTNQHAFGDHTIPASAVYWNP